MKYFNKRIYALLATALLYAFWLYQKGGDVSKLEAGGNANGQPSPVEVSDAMELRASRQAGPSPSREPSEGLIDHERSGIRFSAEPSRPLVRGKKNLLLYPDLRIQDRHVIEGKVFERSPLVNVRNTVLGPLTVNGFTLSSVEADVDLQAVESFLRSDAEFLPLPLNAEEVALMRVERAFDRGEHTVTLAGTLQGQDLSEAMIVFHDGAVYGTLQYHQLGRVVEYGASGLGAVAIRELDTKQNLHGNCALCEDPRAERGAVPETPPSVSGDSVAIDSMNTESFLGINGSALSASSDTIVDFVVTYNADAQTALGGVAATEAKVLLSADGITTAMRNSEIHDYVVALLATALETEASGNSISVVNEIIEDRTANANATYLYVSELRELLGADIAVYMYSGGSGSAGVINSFEYSIGSLSIASPGSNFSHEFGHCGGAYHAWGDTEAVNWSPTGWRFVLDGKGYRTLMAYSSPVTAGSERIGYWSNPNQTLTVTDGSSNIVDEAALGAALGYDATGDPHADPSLVRGGRTATFDANGVYVSGGYSQYGFSTNNPSRANLGAMVQAKMESTKLAKANFKSRTGLALLDSPSGTYSSREDVTVFAFAGDHFDTVQMDLYRNGTFVRTIDTNAMAHAHTLTWEVPTTGLETGDGYKIHLTTDGGTVLQSDAFSIDMRDFSPVAHWTLDDCSGMRVQDESGHGHDASLVTGTWIRGGKVDGALRFEGGTDSVVVPASTFSSVSNQITIAMWIYGVTNQPLDDAVLYAEDTDSNVVLRIRLPAIDSSVTWDAGSDGGGVDRLQYTPLTTSEVKGQWNHWVFTKNAESGEMRMYVNGVPVQNTTGKTKALAGITVAHLGSLRASASYHGMIDEVKLYDMALNDDEVADLYGAYQEIPGLKAHWAFDDSEGIHVQDVSGNSHHATLGSGTWVVRGRVGGAIDINAGSDKVNLPGSAFESITNQITLMMWVFGDTTQPRDDTMLNATDGSNQSILNLHLPWSNGGVFWDAGYDGATPDRLYYAPPSPTAFMGQWNHWTFTKNASTGEMTMYRNGSFVAGATGKTQTMSGVTKATLGAVFWGLSYDGMIDDVKVYDVALSETEVLAAYQSYSGLTGYTAWLANYPGLIDTTFEGDEDDDDTPNGLEYMANQNPLVPEFDSIFSIDSSGDHVVISFYRNAGSEDCTCQFWEVGTNLVAWSGLRIHNPADAEVMIEAEHNGMERVTITFPSSFAGDGPGFGRLRVTPADTQ